MKNFINKLFYQEKEERKVQLTIRENRLKDILQREEKSQEELNKIKEEMERKEKQLMLLKKYEDIIGRKGIQKEIIKMKLERVSDEMNNMLKRNTTYAVEMACATEEKLKTKIIRGGKKLMTERISTYETIMLTATFKRAIMKYMSKTRGKIYIIDESVENMDKENFKTVLPELMKFLLEEYSYIILISQKDVKHVSDHEIKIKREGETPIIYTD